MGSCWSFLISNQNPFCVRQLAVLDVEKRIRLRVFVLQPHFHCLSCSPVLLLTQDFQHQEGSVERQTVSHAQIMAKFW